MNDLIIVGGGPAALAAAIYASGKQIDFRIVAETLGGRSGWRQRLMGQLADEFLAGDDAVQLFAHRVSAAGAVVSSRVNEVLEHPNGFEVLTAVGEKLHGAAVLVATGASPVELHVRGAKEFLGQGVGYSVTTHAHLVADRSVAVIGDTLRALRSAGELARTARRVYLLLSDPALLSDPLTVALRRKPNVEIVVGAAVRELSGGSSVEQIVIERDGELRRLAIDAAFIELHLHANSGSVRRLLNLAPGQFIPVDGKNTTDVPGLFAAGDVTTAFCEHTLIAVGEGTRAVRSIYDYLLARE